MSQQLLQVTVISASGELEVAVATDLTGGTEAGSVEFFKLRYGVMQVTSTLSELEFRLIY